MAVLRRGIHDDLRTMDGSRLNMTDTLAAVEIPPSRLLNIPRVEHFLASETGLITKVVSQSLDLPESFVKELVRFGAIYSCPVVPFTSPNEAHLSKESKEELLQIRTKAIARYGRNPCLQRPFRVESESIIEKDSYLRVHVHPKRFPAFYHQDWDKRIIFENQHCVVVNKPSGCQVPPRVDNRLECLTYWVQQHVNFSTELKPVHRLDTGTEGVVILAKTKEFAKYFQKLLLGSQESGCYLKKQYRALTRKKPPLGIWSHFIKPLKVPGQAPRSVIDPDGSSGGVYAEMKITSSQLINLSDSATALWHEESVYENLIELKTGRTHQIRVQLAYEGFPLLGDGLYEPLSSSNATISEANDWCLGLQAMTVEIFDHDLSNMFETETSICFNAGDPFWKAH